MSLQAKVLTAIEDHKIRRVGGNKTIGRRRPHYCRHQSQPEEPGRAGEVPEDLFHRLDLYRISLPPLRSAAGTS